MPPETLFSRLTPDQLQEYLLCPSRFYFRYVQPLPFPVPAIRWLDQCCHQTLLETLKQHESSPYGLSWFEDQFYHPTTPQGEKLLLDWGDDSPEKLFDKGKRVLTLYLASPFFLELDPLLVDVTVPIPLYRDVQKKTVYPLSLMIDKPGSLTVPTSLDVVLREGTILQFRLSSRVLTEDFLAAEILADLSSLAPLYLPTIPLPEVQLFRGDVLVRSNLPKVQKLFFRKTYADTYRLLHHLYPILTAIDQELFFPTPNILCARHCPFLVPCHRHFRRETPSPQWRAQYREIFLLYLATGMTPVDPSPIPSLSALPSLPNQTVEAV